MYIYTSIHTYIDIYIHTYIHRYNLYICKHTYIYTCVHTIGYICPLTWKQVTGCCDNEHSKRFDCSGCMDNSCCAVYEHCVSCCLHPDKVILLYTYIYDYLLYLYRSQYSNLFYIKLQNHFILYIH